jgi:hypothetical protein
MQSFNKNIDLKSKTPTELLKLVENIKERHDKIKQETLFLTDDLENIQNKINKNVEELQQVEDFYVTLMLEIDSR